MSRQPSPQPLHPLPPSQQSRLQPPPPLPQQPPPPLLPQQPPPQQGQLPKLPCPDIYEGRREDYLRIGVPLYEASLNCNWKAAKAILEVTPDLVRYSITENGETPLHIVASVKDDSRRVVEFVKNLVAMMGPDDLELQNKHRNTALYLAACAGNLKTVKIMAAANMRLFNIPGAIGARMPLHAAAFFGNKDVVEYIYKETKILGDEQGWNPVYRSRLVEKCIENNMFDTALKIVKNHPDIDAGSVLRALARKPEAFHEKESSHLVSWLPSSSQRASKKEGNALPLLRFIWDDVVKKPIREIDIILRGPPDSNKKDSKTDSGSAVKVMQLRKIISDHLENMKVETNNLSRQGLSESTNALHLQDLISESLVNMHVKTQKISLDHPNSIIQDNKPFSNKERLARELQRLIFKHIADMDDKVLWIITILQLEMRATSLKTCIFEHIGNMSKETDRIIKTYDTKTYSSRILFIAAEKGNTIFLVELIRRYPDLVSEVNENNQSIFHVAVKHRHNEIYNLLHEIGARKDLITRLKDTDGNNMWTLAAKITTEERLAVVSGVAFQMQLELSWFHEVMKVIPPPYTLRENVDGVTPHEIFTKEHKNLARLSEEWMKGTASQCMVVAALIATIVFAATFTIPGGYDQTSGIPIFHSKATFAVFVVADAISLISSSASILIFLSILTSRYAENDFLESLPRKLLLGLATLFLSITSMMVTFGVSFLVLYGKGNLLWMPILICVLLVYPVLLYERLHYRLFNDLIRSAYLTRYLFKPQKHLYYERPMF